MRPSISRDRHLRLGQLLRDRPLQLLDDALGDAPLVLDLGLERLVGGRLEGAERRLLELVLDLAHPQPVGDGGVDVERLLGDAAAPLLGQVVDRPHVVLAIGELDEDDADVVDHRQQHLAEVLGLAGLARGERDRPDLGDALDDVGDFRPEQLLDPADGGEGVLDHVVEQAGGDGHDVQPHVGQQAGHFEGVDEVGLARNGGPGPCARGRRRRTPASAARCRRQGYWPGPCRRDPRTESSRWCLKDGAGMAPAP